MSANLSRGDLKLVRQAINKRWTGTLKEEALQRTAEEVLKIVIAPIGQINHRAKLMAARTLLQLHQTDCQLDLQAPQETGTTIHYEGVLPDAEHCLPRIEQGAGQNPAKLDPESHGPVWQADGEDVLRGGGTS